MNDMIKQALSKKIFDIEENYFSDLGLDKILNIEINGYNGVGTFNGKPHITMYGVDYTIYTLSYLDNKICTTKKYIHIHKDKLTSYLRDMKIVGLLDG